MLDGTINLKDEEIYLQLQAAVEAEELTGNLPTYYFKIRRRSDDLSFTIYPTWRGHHYAGKACLLLLQLARQHQMESLIITCRPENIASRKTCLFIGAEFQEIFELPEGHDLRRNGTKMCRYKVIL